MITGTHFTPAQAVIEELKANYQVDLTYIGRQYTMEGDKTASVESRVLPALGVKYRNLVAGRLQRSFSLYTIPSLLKIPIGFVQAFYYLLKDRPDVVLSFGGYVSVPVVVCAWLLSIPVIIHEQTLVSSLANRIGSIFATKIAVSFDQDYIYPKEKIVVTGNPIRSGLVELGVQPRREVEEILKLAKRDHLKLILMTGGNQGSHLINEAVGEVLGKLTKGAVVIHQCGDSKYRDFEALTLKKASLANPERYLVAKWFDVGDWRAIFKQADLAVSRAGANTLAELWFFKVPTLLIPIPYLNQNEQTVNAEHYRKLGLAQIINQRNLTGQTLLLEIEQMLKMAKPGHFEDDTPNSQNAAAVIAQQIVLLAK